LVKHVAEQQKYGQSLSPEDKAQMFYNNTDAHRKQHESLPLEKKVKMLETNAAAHKKQRKYLSPHDNQSMLMHIKRNVSLFHLKIKINL
jgi:hypothetical protein